MTSHRVNDISPRHNSTQECGVMEHNVPIYNNLRPNVIVTRAATSRPGRQWPMFASSFTDASNSPQVVQVLQRRRRLHIPGFRRVKPLRQGVSRGQTLERRHGAGGRPEHQPVEVLQGKLRNLPFEDAKRPGKYESKRILEVCVRPMVVIWAMCGAFGVERRFARSTVKLYYLRRHGCAAVRRCTWKRAVAARGLSCSQKADRTSTGLQTYFLSVAGVSVLHTTQPFSHS